MQRTAGRVDVVAGVIDGPGLQRVPVDLRASRRKGL
jgi:hypothetical protein